MKRIIRYNEEKNGHFTVYFDGQENPLFCDSKEFNVLQCEDMIARHCVSDGLKKVLGRYKVAIEDVAYDRGFRAGLDYHETR